jgi:hypothetical protein
MFPTVGRGRHLPSPSVTANSAKAPPAPTPLSATRRSGRDSGLPPLRAGRTPARGGRVVISVPVHPLPGSLTIPTSGRARVTAPSSTCCCETSTPSSRPGPGSTGGNNSPGAGWISPTGASQANADPLRRMRRATQGSAGQEAGRPFIPTGVGWPAIVAKENAMGGQNLGSTAHSAPLRRPRTRRLG